MNEEEPTRNYFNTTPQSSGALKYRLDSRDVITDVIDNLRGGRVRDENGKVAFNSKYRLMNEEGIHAVSSFLRGIVTKIGHLTRYNEEDRVHKQVRSAMRAFLFELTLNLKKWSPPGHLKVRDKRIVVQIVENAIHQSMSRAIKGAEADLTGKGHTVSEIIDPQQQQKRRWGGLFG